MTCLRLSRGAYPLYDLLVMLKIPPKGEKDEDAAAVLEVQAVARRGGVGE